MFKFKYLLIFISKIKTLLKMFFAFFMVQNGKKSQKLNKKEFKNWNVYHLGNVQIIE